MLHDWLKNIVRLFSAYLNKETRKKLLCHGWKFYLGVSSNLLVTSQVMSILRNLERIKARRKANSRETRCDIDLAQSLDSVNLSQQTRQVTVPSYSETHLDLLDYETASESGTSGLKKPRSNYQTYSPNERYSKYFTKVQSGISKTNGNCSFDTSKVCGRIKVSIKQKREPKSKLPVEQRGRLLILGKIDLIGQNYL